MMPNNGGRGAMSNRVFVALLAAVFVVALGYGVVLPVLPTMVRD